MSVIRRQMRVGFAALCVVMMMFGQSLFLTNSIPLAMAAPTFHLPWEQGSVWRMTNGNNGPGHQDVYNQYAFDAVPDPGRSTRQVTAIAGGHVLGFQNDIPNEALFNAPHAGNCMMIQHDDGSVSLYAHLAAGSIPAELRSNGAEVRGGMVIATAGDTGYATGIHLHWSLQSDGQMYTAEGYSTCYGSSIPSQYADNDRELIEDGGVPRAGRYYESFNTPGGGGSVANDQPVAVIQPVNDPAPPQASLVTVQMQPTGEVGRPPLPYGIVRLPFDGRYEITQVPGCGEHITKGYLPKKYNEMNARSFDFGLRDGTQVLASGEGDVLPHFTDSNGSNILIVDHGNGVRSYYVHISEFLVPEGTHVYPGDVIALSGQTGAPGQPHLHFAVTENGDPETSGYAANINSLPGIPWDTEQLNDDGYAICNSSARDFAVGGPVALLQEPEVVDTIEPVATEEPMMDVYGYDRWVAVDVAFGALNESAGYDDASTWYAAVVLRGGGIQNMGQWTDMRSAAPNDFVNYLVDNYVATSSPIDWWDNTASGAELGDIIAYDWDGDGTIDHLAVVTNINSDGYPEVSEHAPVSENRYWSYSETDDNWIQAAHPSSVAYLIHIAPITVPGF